MSESPHNHPTEATVQWKAIAVTMSAVISVSACVRMVSNAIGIVHGSTAAYVVSAATQAVMMLVLGVLMPHLIVTAQPVRPLGQRIVRIVPLAAFLGVMQYFILSLD